MSTRRRTSGSSSTATTSMRRSGSATGGSSLRGSGTRQGALSRKKVREVEAPIVGSSTAASNHSLEANLKSLETELPLACHVVVAHFTVTNSEGHHKNEDRVLSHRDLLPWNNTSLHTIGVADGHDGDCSSDMVSRCLPEAVNTRLKTGVPVVEAYISTMADFEQRLEGVASSSGTCVLSCTVAGNYVWCANLGDCRAALVNLKLCPRSERKEEAGIHKSTTSLPSTTEKKEEAAIHKSTTSLPSTTTYLSQASGSLSNSSGGFSRQASGSSAEASSPQISSLVWISRDQKVDTPEELRRIKAAGGKVVDGGVKGLRPSRTLGDFDVKRLVKTGVISIKPEVRVHQLSNGADKAQALLVCATDGVWDVVTGQDLCDLITAHKDLLTLQAAIGKSSDSDRTVLQAIAEDIVRCSVDRGSEDDCTAVVSLISVCPDIDEGERDVIPVSPDKKTVETRSWGSRKCVITI